MDAYRAIHGPAPECKTWPFLYRILNTAQPMINIDKASVHHIHEREPVKFFPQRAIKDIFNPKADENPVEQILKCRCSTCMRCEALKSSELEKVGGKIIRSSTTLLAILIYVGHGYLIKYFGPNDRASDVSLDSVTSHLQHEENRSLQKNPWDIFQPPTFDLGGPTAPYGRSYRMPFLRDEHHAQGASGKVRKFNIHEDYLGKGIKDADWYRNSKSEFKFARKILKKVAISELDWQVERENLEVFTRGRHPSIIHALCFYQWRGRINFVFPFIDGTLEKLLGGQWSGPEKDYLETMDPPHHWLWAQMIGVAEGLSTIHNLQNTDFKRDGKRMIGFHFDLKPADILITLKGELKISDFGLSLIKRIEFSSLSHGFFRGGTPKYQAPEVSRLRGIAPYIPTGLTADEDMSESANNKYDVWSYACIALEVLIYISGENGIEMLMRFGKAVNEEPLGCAFWYNGKLKNCVDDALRRIGGNTTAGEEVVGQSAWAKVTVAYLQQNMFEFDPSLRPSSIEVADRLQRICDEHADTPNDELELELRKYSREEYPKDRFHEIYWHTVNGDVSFLKMEGISFTWPDVPDNVYYPCKLNIWCNGQDGHFVVVRSFKRHTVYKREQSLAGAQFVPLYAYRRLREQSSHECGIIDREREVRYCFQTQDDLNSFQDVLLSHRLLYKSDQPIQSINLHGKDQAKIDAKTLAYRVQVWEYPNAATPQQTMMSSVPAQDIRRLENLGSCPELGQLSPRYRILIFLDNECIKIPLSDGNPRLSYGRAGRHQEKFKSYTTATTIMILPDRQKYFSVSRTKSKARLQAQGNAPALPLSPEAFLQADLKTKHVALHFGTSSDTQEFANFFKNHHFLKQFWFRCEKEEDDESQCV